MESGFTIDDDKLAEVIRIAQTGLQDSTERAARHITEYILADWPEGRGHQDWLNEASAEEIAGWAIEGLRNWEVD